MRKKRRRWWRRLARERKNWVVKTLFTVLFIDSYRVYPFHRGPIAGGGPDLRRRGSGRRRWSPRPLPCAGSRANKRDAKSPPKKQPTRYRICTYRRPGWEREGAMKRRGSCVSIDKWLYEQNIPRRSPTHFISEQSPTQEMASKKGTKRIYQYRNTLWAIAVENLD